MDHTVTASLICAAYNQASQLALVLDSLKAQTRRDIEVIIADDGSNDNTPEVVEEFEAECGFPVKHVWQEDEGFHKTRILNMAIRDSSAEYLIFIDGDMILEKHFIENHSRYRRDKHVLCGYRGVKLNPDFTQKLLARESSLDETAVALLRERLSGNLKHPGRGLILHSSLLRKVAVPKRRGLSGCNFSLYRRAIERVNGFNEDMLEHGYEDYELGHRLVLAGYQLRNVSKLCNTYHLHHPTRKTRREATRKGIAEVDVSTDVRCKKGLVHE